MAAKRTDVLFSFMFLIFVTLSLWFTNGNVLQKSYQEERARAGQAYTNRKRETHIITAVNFNLL